MEFRNIQCFVMAAKAGNFTRAAEQLFISQSALSQSIKRMETELGVTLFNRQNNIVTLTTAGEIFLPEADALLARVNLLKTHMAEIALNHTETLNFGISSFYSMYFLPDIIAFAQRIRPHIHINCIEETSAKLQEMVVGGILDCCVCPMPVDYDELQVSYMRTENIYLAFPSDHPILTHYHNDSPVPLSILAEEPFVFLKKTRRFTEFVIKLCTEAGFVPNIIYETSNCETVNTIIGHGLGIGFVPDVIVRKNRNGKTQYRCIASENASRGFVLMTRKDVNYPQNIMKFFSELPSVFD